MLFERHSLKVNGYSAIAPKRVTKNRLQKQRKASGNGEYNLIKYVRCHHHTRCEEYPLNVLFKGAGQ
jgi:hypothetical protein